MQMFALLEEVLHRLLKLGAILVESVRPMVGAILLVISSDFEALFKVWDGEFLFLDLFTV